MVDSLCSTGNPYGNVGVDMILEQTMNVEAK